MPLFHVILLLAALGAAGGFLSGLLGVGGGVIFVPALYYYFTALGAPHAMHLAIGTSLAVIIVTSATSTYWHNRKGAVDFGVIRRWAPFILAGVAAGSYLAALVDGAVLKKIFSVVLAALALSVGLTRESEKDSGAPRPARFPAPVQYAIATGIGMLSSMIGVGGAAMSIPAMAHAGLPMRRAVGTGSMVGVCVAGPAALGYVLSGLHETGLPPFSWGYVNLAAFVLVTPFCFALSPVGVNMSHRLPRNTLRRVFAAVLVIVALKMLVTA
jgi:uncharacterized membrane protein YfcA